MGRRHVLGLGEVLVQMVEFPDVALEGLAWRMVGDRLPAALPQAAVAEHLEVLRRTARRVGVAEAGGEGDAFHGLLLDAGEDLGSLEAQQFEDRGRHVAGVAELVTQLAAGLDAVRPTGHQRVADAAAMGVLLVALEGGVRRHGPAPGEVGVGVGATDVVDAGDLLGHGFWLAVVGAHGVDHAEGAALLAGAVVAQDQDQGVVAQAGLIQEGDKAGQVAVGVVQHGGEGALEAGEQALFIRRMLGPWTHHVVARRHAGVGRHDAHGLLPRQALLALHVPALREHRVVVPDQVLGRLVRGVAGAVGEPAKPGLVRRVGGVVGDVADGLVGQVLGQVVAVGIPARRIDRCVVPHKFGRELVGLRVHEAVVAVEPAAQRPALERAGRSRLGQGCDVPLADHVVAIAGGAQHLRQGAGLGRDLAAVARIAGVEVGQAADAHRMVVASRQQRRPRGGAHGGRVKAGVAQAFSGQGVDGGRGDGRAVAAEVGEADVVEQHDQDVGAASRRLGRGRPPRLGLRNGLADPAAISCIRHVDTPRRLS